MCYYILHAFDCLFAMTPFLNEISHASKHTTSYNKAVFSLVYCYKNPRFNFQLHGYMGIDTISINKKNCLYTRGGLQLTAICNLILLHNFLQLSLKPMWLFDYSFCDVLVSFIYVYASFQRQKGNDTNILKGCLQEFVYIPLNLLLAGLNYIIYVTNQL